MRGEYNNIDNDEGDVLELPPRARRILYLNNWLEAVGGTTSACAENTVTGDLPPAVTGNYLRVRGEYSRPAKRVGAPKELPPRARRIQMAFATVCDHTGTTSACAENTPHLTARTPTTRNYLRVRGEYQLNRRVNLQ